MSKQPDENDRAIDGSLPADPSAETLRAKPPLRAVKAGETNGEPCDIPAERALLGALLWAGANQPQALRIGAVLDVLETGEPFFSRGLGDVYDAIRACREAKCEHDAIAVYGQLVKAGKARCRLETLHELASEASTVNEVQARHYATAIRRAWARRVVVRELRIIAEDARDPKRDLNEIVERAQSVTGSLAARAAPAASSVSIKQSAEVFFKKLQEGKNDAMATGIQSLDEALNGGLRPGEVSVLAARTNVGKSCLSAQIGEHIVSIDPTTAVLYVSLEMAHETFTARLVSARSGVPISNLRRGVLNPSQWSDVTGAMSELANRGLYFADNPSQTLSAIYATALERSRMLAREGKSLGLIVIDHLGLVKPSAEATKKMSREGQVAETSRGQRFLASQLHVHVLGIAQINRAAEQNGVDRMPRLHQIRESGAIEADADIVMIMHRERDAKTGLFRKDKPPALNVAKGRMDETAIMLLDYDGARARFSDFSGQETFGDVYGVSS